MVYDADRPFYTWPAHIVYSQELDQSIINRIDKAIMDMADAGLLAKLMPSNFVENYDDYLLPQQQNLHARD